MVSKMSILFLVISITLVGCGAGQVIPPNATETYTATVPPTETASLAPTLTNTPNPTKTNTPSPTAIPLPDRIPEFISNAAVIYQDQFDSSLVVPKGWDSCPAYPAAWLWEENHLTVEPIVDHFGATFYYADKMIHPNEAVYFLFVYSGNRYDITLGFDGYVNGNACSRSSTDSLVGFYTVALDQSPGVPLRLHSQTAGSEQYHYFQGDWRLQEQTWYSALMGYDQSNTFFFYIWEPLKPDRVLSSKQTYADFPNSYNFIGWVPAPSKLLLDDFTILTFDILY